jgi:hypothetical protein
MFLKEVGEDVGQMAFGGMKATKIKALKVSIVFKGDEILLGNSVGTVHVLAFSAPQADVYADYLYTVERTFGVFLAYHGIIG